MLVLRKPIFSYDRRRWKPTGRVDADHHPLALPFLRSHSLQTTHAVVGDTRVKNNVQHILLHTPDHYQQTFMETICIRVAS